LQAQQAGSHLRRLDDPPHFEQRFTPYTFRKTGGRRFEQLSAELVADSPENA
jgi:hypothetical protein